MEINIKELVILKRQSVQVQMLKPLTNEIVFNVTKHELINAYLPGARETVCFVIPRVVTGDVFPRRFIILSSVKVNDRIKQTNSVWIE